jgi:hypothetical protein
MKNIIKIILLYNYLIIMDNKSKIIKVLTKNNEYDQNQNQNITINNDILEKIFNITSEIYDTHKKILEKINSFEVRIQNIEKKIDSTLKNNELSSINLKELKKEELNLNKEDVIKALSYRDYRSVIYIFKNIYKNKTNLEYVYPIRITGKRSFEYYNNMKWNPDLYGHYCISVICNNFQNLFIKYNNIEDIDSDNFIMNQQFICKLSDEKYQKSIFKNIIEEVRINNSN